MNKEDLFKASIKLLRQSQYEKVSKLLEPNVPIFISDPKFLYLIGSACYLQGDYKGAEVYLEKGLRCEEDSLEIRLMLAATMLRKRDTATAIRLWLEVLDIDPDNKRAQYGLDALKELDNTADLARFIRSSSMHYLVVPFKKMPSLRLFFTLSCSLALVLGMLVFVGYIAINPTFIYNYTREFRSNEYSAYKAMKELDYVADAGVFYNKYDLEQVNQIMATAADYIFLFRYNLAQIEYNKIKNSNAPVVLKEKALKWELSREKPTFDNLKDNINYKEVVSEPYLYENCYVKWEGSITDITINKEFIGFNLLVGYADKKVLEGSIPVYLDFEVALDKDLPTQVLAKLKIDKNNKIYLQGVSLYQSLNRL